MPAGRTDPPPLVPTPGLDVADSYYQRVMALDPGPLVHGASSASEVALAAMAHELTAATAAYRAAPGPLAEIASTRLADLYDLVGSRYVQMYATDVPRGLDEERRWFVSQFYCYAAHYYRRALEANPRSDRASTQLAAYGVPLRESALSACLGSP